MTYLSFDLDDGQWEEAKKLIDSLGCKISKDNVIAVLSGTSVEHVAQLRREVESSRPKRSTFPTVAELIGPYCKHLQTKENPTQEDTIEKYKAMLNTFWLPRLGHLRVDQVTKQDIAEAMLILRTCTCRNGVWGDWCGKQRGTKNRSPREQHEPGLAKKTRDRYFSVIRGLFNYAVEEGLPQSPVGFAGYKQQSLAKYNELKKEEKHFYLTKPQFALVRSKMRPELQVMLNLMGETGLRFSEVTALQKKKIIAHPKPKILVSEAFKKVKKRPGVPRGQRVTGIPKGGKTDVIGISMSLAMQIENLAKGKGQDDLVFTTTQGFSINHSNFFRDEWIPAIHEAMRCPEHPPAVQVQVIRDSAELLGPRCGDNGGRNAKNKLCNARVITGTNRCSIHVGVARDAVSDCECTDARFPRRLPRRLTPHDIRHTYAAWRIADDDVNSLAIADRMRHGIDVFNRVYAGLLDEVRDRLTEKSAIDF